MSSYYVFTVFGLTVLFSLIVFWRTKDMFHPMVIFPVVFAYFTLGPVITHVTGGEIYVGIVTDKINDAMLVFVLALVGMGMAIIPLFDPQPLSWDIQLTEQNKKQVFWYINAFALLLNAVSVLFVAVNIQTVLSLGKGILNLIPIYGLWHFNYLMFWTFFISILLALDYWRTSKVALLNLAGYCAYCLIMNERDFVLILFTILVYRTSTKKLSRTYSVLSAAAISIVFALLFWQRSNPLDTDFVEVYLGQGSNLNIITNLMVWMDNWLPRQNGWTYVQSTINLLPSFIYREGVPLTTWFMNELAPDSGSGYGFSLEGEAYMNFGYPGVFVFFLLFGKVLIYFYRSKQHGNLFGYYMYYFCMCFVTYTLRGDSLMLFKGFTYATGFFYFMLFLAGKGALFFRKIPRTSSA